nr:leucine--tRNA ligase [Bacteroidia bacterium]
MGHYDFNAIDKKWQKYWKENRTFAASTSSDKPKYYVLDMFPYPSGKGLHVGHPLGYVATDIVARYKQLQGFNVLHPMGFDAFGLPAEQYAIETGTHPDTTTRANIVRYLQQIETLGMAYDPDSNDVWTCKPDYYKWTQWIFVQLFNSWYNQETNKAEPIADLVAEFEKGGSFAIIAACDQEEEFSADEWNSWDEKKQQETLMNYRLAYITEGTVNWCPELGTVLANDEVIDGKSERGGHPVFQKKMRQWVMRMTAYADRLLEGLDRIEWSESLKEQQRNWIGRSEGAEFDFRVQGHDANIRVFSTRPDTLFGATFMVLAPEHELVAQITTPAQKAEIEEYVAWSTNRTELERKSEVKHVTGCFTGAYAINPFTEKPVPVWIADYVLMGYGTGAIMCVPGHDERDHRFAKHFNLPIVEVVSGGNVQEEAYVSKDAQIVNSDFLNGMKASEAIPAAIGKLVDMGIGEAQVNFRLRDPNFSRQRYWGEPFPVVFRDGMPYVLDEKDLPVTLPEVESYKPTGDGESPLANVSDWVNTPQGMRETHTMPGYAGSSWYFLRYCDPFNENEFASREKTDYWMNVDLYVGGTEHAVGHLLYSRFWTKFLYDLGKISHDEPFQKLVNQGMIQGRSSLAYKKHDENTFVSFNKGAGQDLVQIHVDISFVENDVMNLDAFMAWHEDYQDAKFILEDDGTFICDHRVEKMGKRYHNVTNPDDICNRFGADIFRCYEMFLGPLEMSKPWITNGIEGVSKFFKRLWNLFTDDDNNLTLSDEAPSKAELKLLHQTIKKAGEDIEKLSFNTTIPQFMIFVNEMTRMNGNKRAILEPFLVVLAPFAPHTAEELWSMLGHQTSITEAAWPAWKAEFLVEDSFEYPVQINGKVRTKLNFANDLSKEEIESEVLKDEDVQKWISGLTLRKIIVVPKRIINLVAN